MQIQLSFEFTLSFRSARSVTQIIITMNLISVISFSFRFLTRYWIMQMIVFHIFFMYSPILQNDFPQLMQRFLPNKWAFVHFIQIFFIRFSARYIHYYDILWKRWFRFYTFEKKNHTEIKFHNKNRNVNRFERINNIKQIKQ